MDSTKMESSSSSSEQLKNNSSTSVAAGGSGGPGSSVPAPPKTDLKGLSQQPAVSNPDLSAKPPSKPPASKLDNLLQKAEARLAAASASSKMPHEGMTKGRKEYLMFLGAIQYVRT